MNAAAAAAKSLQSYPTLCDTIDGSPPGSPIPGIPQARTLEWVAISFSNAWKWKVTVKSLSRVRLSWNSAVWWVYLSFSPLPLASVLLSAICKAYWDKHFAFYFLGYRLDPVLSSCSVSFSLLTILYFGFVLIFISKIIKESYCKNFLQLLFFSLVTVCWLMEILDEIEFDFLKTKIIS